MVRATPRRLHDLYLRIGEAREVLLQELGRPPGVPEIASRLGCSTEDVLEALEASGGFGPTSLDAPTGAGGRTMLDALGGDDPNFATSLEGIALGEALRILPPDDRRLLQWYFVDDRTQLDIANQLDCSQMQISRRLNRITGQLRARIAA